MAGSGITFTGLSSGINWQSIIQQMLTMARAPEKVYQQQEQTLINEQTALGKFQASLTGLQSAANSLNQQNAFNLVTASSSNTSTATVSANAGAQTGTHTLVVNQLAQAQKLGSIAQSSQTNPLGVSGQIVINGHAITVQSSDTLQTLAANINNANAGVTASIIETAPNSYNLILTANNSGTANEISLSDVGSGTILQSTLGLIGSAEAVANPITNGAGSALFSDSSTSIGTLLGMTSPTSGTIQINGTSVSIDFSTDSLTSIANKINSAGISGVSAAVIAVTNPTTGAAEQQLQITGSTTPTFTDSNNILANLGILQNSVSSSQLQAAQDANFTLDNLSITRSSNTVTDVIPNVTLSLLSGGGATSNITVNPDTSTMQQNITGYVNAFNSMVDTLQSQANYDPTTNVTGPLFGESTTQNVLNELVNQATSSVSGLPSTLSTLSQIGITLDQNDHLVVNSATLSNALTTNPNGVAALFQATGTTTDSAITYVYSTNKTQDSGSAGYAINITQPATQATASATVAQTSANSSQETLTFSGTLIGSNPYSITLNSTNTLSDTVAQINADPTLSPLLTASIVSGELSLQSKAYGSSGDFTVVSSQAAASNNSGIGTTPINATGLDVAGTINGEAATGNGQYLTGNSGNATTDGLEIKVNTTVAGSHGSIVFSQGVADQMTNFISSATDPLSGSLTELNNSLNTQVQDIQNTIQDIEKQVAAEATMLQQEFAAMEMSVAQLQQAGASLSSLTGLSSSSSSSGSGSSTGSSPSSSSSTSGG